MSIDIREDDTIVRVRDAQLYLVRLVSEWAWQGNSSDFRRMATERYNTKRPAAGGGTSTTLLVGVKGTPCDPMTRAATRSNFDTPIELYKTYQIFFDSNPYLHVVVDKVNASGGRMVSLALMRGSSNLAAQNFRVEVGGGGSLRESNRSGEARGRVLLMGEITANIQPRDRFALEGVLYQVIYVRPNRDAATLADAEVSE